MELRANLLNDYHLYNALCYATKKEKEVINCFPTEAEFLNIFNNPGLRKQLRNQLAPELSGSLLNHFLNQNGDSSVSPFWQYTILKYTHPVQAMHSESDSWVLNLEINLKSTRQIQLIQKRILEIINTELPGNVLCLGARAVVGLPELGRNLSICCIESDENLLCELRAIYAMEQESLKSVLGDFHHYCPDRKYDLIIYPSGKTWQETEKMQALLLKLRNYLKPEKGRVLAY
jgi:hypothetical protein